MNHALRNVHRWIIQALLIGTVGLSQAAIPPDLATPGNAIDPAAPPREWTLLLGESQTGEDLEARFAEQRENDFRRGHRAFSGTVRVWSDRGVSLHYDGLEVTLVAAPGVVWRRPADGDWASYAADPESDMAGWSQDLWRLDLGALAHRFEIFGRMSGDAGWEMLLEARGGRLPRIYLRGNAEAVSRIEIEHNPRRRTVFSLSEIHRSPDTDGWDQYFPEE